MNKDLIKYGLNNLWHRKKRSLLTVISIFIGIMAIFALISFGQGLSSYVKSISSEMGTDKIVMQPKGGFGNPTESAFQFNEEDVEFVKKVSGVSEATGMIVTSVQVQQDTAKKSRYVYAQGIPTEQSEQQLINELFATDLGSGRELKKGDTDKVAVGYGYSQPNTVFEKPIGLGDKLYINGKKVEVIGIYEPIGNPIDDMNIYFTSEAMVDFLGAEKEYATIFIRSSASEDPREVAKTVEEKFRKYKDQDEGKETFFVQTFEDLIASFSTILGILNTVLVLISLISVVVAAVNIMNTTYTSVLERTQEIGIMKAIGAQNRHILFVFVFEAGVLGIIGSAVGMFFGYLIAKAGGFFAASAGYSMLQPAFPLWLVLGCLVFGFFMGALSGLAPAYQASKQKPVEALRYE
ncbi:ABC transporter permease [Candidatus Woesearchaeota archaeon]|nr:MAG: ABC transporter permease [Candidatus Woesearchaeota archaeon]